MGVLTPPFAYLGNAAATGGVQYLLRDLFTGTNGTSIASHAMDVGSGWTLEVATGTIQSNRLSSGDGMRVITDAGTADLDISVDFILPAATGDYSAGIVIRRQDSSNHWLFQAVGSGDVRILDLVAGSYTVRDPTTWSADTASHTMRVVASDEEMSLYLDGVLKCAWVSGFLEQETEHGLRGNTGVLFDNLSAVGVVHPYAGADFLIGAIGDSITADPINAPTTVTRRVATALSTGGANAIGQGTVAVINRGYSGSNSGEWTSGSTHLTESLAHFSAAGLLAQPVNQRPVQIMLGTNDANDSLAFSNTVVHDNLDSAVGALLLAGYAPIILHYPPGFEPGVFAGFGAAALTRVQAYGTGPIADIVAERAITNPGKVFAGDTTARTYFADSGNYDELADGLHPNGAGSITLAGLWATALEGIL